MDKTVDVVYETYDYSKFRKLDSNRKVTEARKVRLIESFECGEIKNPIIVNEKYEIIDGQGRYEAKKELGLPIQYIIDIGKTIIDCRRMNQYNTKWSVKDYIDSHAESGNENYIRLLDAAKKLGVPCARVMKAAGKNTAFSKWLNEDNPIVNGDLVFTENDAERAIDVTNKTREIVDALCFTGRVNDSVLTAVKVMVNTAGYNHNVMLNHCKLCRSNYTQMARLEDQLKEFSRIYNHKMRNQGKLFFEDYMRNKGSNVRNYYAHEYVLRKENQEDISTLV